MLTLAKIVKDITLLLIWMFLSAAIGMLLYTAVIVLWHYPAALLVIAIGLAYTWADWYIVGHTPMPNWLFDGGEGLASEQDGNGSNELK